MLFSTIEDLRYRLAKFILPRRRGARIPVFNAGSGYHFAPDYLVARSFKLPDIRNSEPFGSLASKAVRSGRTCLYYERLHTLYAGILNAVRLNADPCAIVEIGVFRGGGSRFLAEALVELGAKSPRLFCFDTFGGHCDEDISALADRPDKHSKKTFADTSIESVRDFLSDLPFVSLHKGRFESTCGLLDGTKLGFAHLDVDLHKPIYHALNFLENRMLLGAMIVVDDYGFDTCPGVEQAISEFLAQSRSLAGFPLLGGQFILVKFRD